MFLSKARGIPALLQDPKVRRGLVLSVLLAVAALVIPAVGAIIIGGGSGIGIDGVNGFVESLSGNSSSWLAGLGFGLLAPLGFAFAAGMASAVNPCGFAMLPAYLGLYLGSDQENAGPTFPAKQLGKALLVGASVTAGFVVLFAAVGMVIGFGARTFVVGVLPWLGLGIGVFLVVAGAWMVGGGKFYSGLAARTASGWATRARPTSKGTSFSD